MPAVVQANSIWVPDEKKNVIGWTYQINDSKVVLNKFYETSAWTKCLVHEQTKQNWGILL